MKKVKKLRNAKKKKARHTFASVKKSVNKKQETFVLPSNGKKNVLHVGCGDIKYGSGLHKRFSSDQWNEIRLDIEDAVKPDIVSDMMNMYMIETGSFDAIWSSHNLEHVYSHEVMPVLKEFLRVLKIGGYVFLATPDLQRVAEKAYKEGVECTLYKSPSGPISPLDIIYGFRPSVAKGYLSMAHKTGFSARSLGGYFKSAGFLDIAVERNEYNLWALAYKLTEETKHSSKVRIIGDDMNKMMKARDEIDIPVNIKITTL